MLRWTTYPSGDSTVPAAQVDWHNFDTKTNDIGLNTVTISAQRPSTYRDNAVYSMDEDGNRFRNGSPIMGSDVFSTQIFIQPQTQHSEAVGWADNVLSSLSPFKALKGLTLLSKINPANRAVAASQVADKAAQQIRISDVKSGLKKVYEKLGIDGPLPKGPKGKFGSPTAGTSQKGYRLDPAHPRDNIENINETVPHINWWDWTTGKKGKGGRYGAEPLINP